MQTTRRYDIDWLRVIAIWLLLLYHIAIGFQPWGAMFGFIQNDELITGLVAPMSMLNVWRIPILFYISGMGVCFAMQKRNWRQLVQERSRRILLPLLFGMLAIVPVHILLWQQYYHQDLSYYLRPAHLWFLGNIYLYVWLSLPLVYFLKAHPDSRLSRGIRWMLGRFWGLLVIIAAFVLEVVLVQPDSFAYYAQNLHGFLLGALAYLFGFLIIYTGPTFWQLLLRYRWLLLVVSLSLYLLRWFYFDWEPPEYLLAIESNLWIFTWFALGYRYLNRDSKVLGYLSKSAYPVYILHMVFSYAAAVLIFPLDIAPLLKFSLVSVLTFVGCYLAYEGLRRVGLLRPLFGLASRGNRQPRRGSQ